MTKGKGSQFQTVHIPENMVFVNSAGQPFVIQGLPPLLMADISANVALPKVPTYTVTTASGDVEVHNHDETTLVTQEDKDAWSKYLLELARVNAKVSDQMLTCILLEGVVVTDDTDISRWEKRRRMVGLPVPEDIEERMLAYKRTMVIRCTEDIARLMDSVMALTGISEEELEKTKATFQDKVEPES